MNYINAFLGSAIFYICIVISVCGLSYACSHSLAHIKISNKFNIKCSTILLFLIILIISCVSGLRAKSVGFDTASYISVVINPIQNGYFNAVYSEFGFKILVKVLLLIVNDPYFVIFVIALATNSLIVIRMWELRNISSFPIMIFIYLAFYYFFTFNIFRQFLTIAIIFYFSKYLFKKKYLVFILAVFVSMLIHNVSIIALGLIPLSYFFDINNKREKNIRFYFMLLFPVISAIALALMFQFYDFEHYFNLYEKYGASESGIGLMIIVKLMLCILYYLIIRKTNHNIYETNVNSGNINLISVTTIIGLFITAIFQFANFGERFGLCFLMFEPVFVGLKIKNTNIKKYFYLIYIILGIYTLYVNLKKGSQGVMPYISIFSE